MPVLTPRIGIQKPLGNEYVNRENFNLIWDTIDANVATRAEFEQINTMVEDMTPTYLPANYGGPTTVNFPVGVSVYSVNGQVASDFAAAISGVEGTPVQVVTYCSRIGGNETMVQVVKTATITPTSITDGNEYARTRSNVVMISTARWTQFRLRMPIGTTGRAGGVQLYGGVDSASNTLAATAGAAKIAHDRAIVAENNAKAVSLPLTGGRVSYLNVNDRTYINGDGTITYQGQTLSPMTDGINAKDITNGNIYADRASGFYMGTNVANGPNGTQWTYYEVIRHNPNFMMVKAFDFFSRKEWGNRKINGVWEGWSRVGGGYLVASGNAKYSVPEERGYSTAGVMLVGKHLLPSEGEILVSGQMYKDTSTQGFTWQGKIGVYSGQYSQSSSSATLGVGVTRFNWTNPVGSTIGSIDTFNQMPYVIAGDIGNVYDQWVPFAIAVRVDKAGPIYVIADRTLNQAGPRLLIRNLAIAYDEV